MEVDALASLLVHADPAVRAQGLEVARTLAAAGTLPTRGGWAVVGLLFVHLSGGTCVWLSESMRRGQPAAELHYRRSQRDAVNTTFLHHSPLGSDDA